MKLTSAMVTVLVAHYVKAKATSIDDVARDDPDEIEEALAEEWLAMHSEELPKALACKGRRWAGEVSRAKKSLGPALAAGESLGEIAESDRRLAARIVLKDMELSPFEQEKAVTDMAAQGLSIERIVALSLSLVLVFFPVLFPPPVYHTYGGLSPSFQVLRASPCACHRLRRGLRAII